MNKHDHFDKYHLMTRWISPDCKVWEKHEWGWKFLGIAKSTSIFDMFELKSHDCDSDQDIFKDIE